jgi:hypothetical protein
MPSEMAADVGMSVLDEARLGILRRPRHHLLPVEQREFFQAHGFPGNDIDRYCLDLGVLQHELVHGGNQPLARVNWQDHEWNTELMRQIKDAEVAIKARFGPTATISRRQILTIMERLRPSFQIDGLPYVHYRAPDRSALAVEVP